MKARIDNLLLIDRQQVPSQLLQYSLKILTMNNLELREYVDEEAEKNPFLIKKQNYKGGCDFIEEFPDEYDLQKEIFKEISFLRLDDFEKEIVATLVNNVDGGYLNVDLLKYVSAEKK